MLSPTYNDKPQEPPEMVEEEDEESGSAESDINTQVQVSGDNKEELVFDLVEPHMSFAPKNIPTEGSDVLISGFSRKMSFLPQHRKSSDAAEQEKRRD